MVFVSREFLGFNRQDFNGMKPGRKPISEDGHALTGVEIKRRHDDRASMIDDELDEAFE